LFTFFTKLTDNQGVPGVAEAGGGRKSLVKRFVWYGLLAVVAFLAVLYAGRTERFHIQTDSLVSNVHYVDCAGPNFLFRGGLPLIKDQVFNYNGLKQAMIEAGNRAGIRMPERFFIVDVNLLNVENPVDRERIFVEQQFFKAKPNLGFIQVWGITGTGIRATDPALANNRNYLGRNLDGWLSDRLGERIEIVRQWLTGQRPVPGIPPDLPIVIYAHCVAGCDRTGEFIGAYYLRFMNKSWEEMNALNQSLCRHNRPFNCRNYRADQWYCLWLNLERGFSLNWQQEFPCSGK
jgi:hypothetical protein